MASAFSEARRLAGKALKTSSDALRTLAEQGQAHRQDVAKLTGDAVDRAGKAFQWAGRAGADAATAAAKGLGGAQVAGEDIRVCRIDDCVLGRPLEEVLRVPHQVLVDREVVRNEDRK